MTNKTKTQIKQEKYNARQAAKAVKPNHMSSKSMIDLALMSNEQHIQAANDIGMTNRNKIYNIAGDFGRQILTSIQNNNMQFLTMAMEASRDAFVNRKVNDVFETMDGDFQITEDDLKTINFMKEQFYNLWKDIASVGTSGNKAKMRENVINKIADFIVCVDRGALIA